LVNIVGWPIKKLLVFNYSNVAEKTTVKITTTITTVVAQFYHFDRADICLKHKKTNNIKCFLIFTSHKKRYILCISL